MQRKRNNRELLLHGAIRKQRGGNLAFYATVRTATIAELQSAQGALAGECGRYRYTYQEVRVRAIEARLAELGAVDTASQHGYNLDELRREINELIDELKANAALMLAKGAKTE